MHFRRNPDKLFHTNGEICLLSNFLITNWHTNYFNGICFPRKTNVIHSMCMQTTHFGWVCWKHAVPKFPIETSLSVETFLITCEHWHNNNGNGSDTRKSHHPTTETPKTTRPTAKSYQTDIIFIMFCTCTASPNVCECVPGCGWVLGPQFSDFRVLSPEMVICPSAFHCFYNTGRKNYY